MANASKKNMGTGAQGKGDGSGALTELPENVLPDNMVLSNRDKSQHSGERGLDSRQVQTDQYRDHVGARRDFDETGAPRQASVIDANEKPGPFSDMAGDEGSIQNPTPDR
jgi:hypothetical protein